MLWRKANKPKQPPKLSGPKDYEHLGRMMVNIYETGYLNAGQTYKMSFLKGMAGGLGGVIGATIVVALLLWALSLFENVPLIGRITNNVQQTIQQPPVQK